MLDIIYMCETILLKSFETKFSTFYYAFCVRWYDTCVSNYYCCYFVRPNVKSVCNYYLLSYMCVKRKSASEPGLKCSLYLHPPSTWRFAPAVVFPAVSAPYANLEKGSHRVIMIGRWPHCFAGTAVWCTDPNHSRAVTSTEVLTATKQSRLINQVAYAYVERLFPIRSRRLRCQQLSITHTPPRVSLLLQISSARPS